MARPRTRLTTNMSGVAYHNNYEFTQVHLKGWKQVLKQLIHSTNSSSSNTVGSGTIQDLLKAGTDVYLRANQDITISNSISVEVQAEIFTLQDVT